MFIREALISAEVQSSGTASSRLGITSVSPELSFSDSECPDSLSNLTFSAVIPDLVYFTI